jgi:hypothetical protein
MVVLGVSVRKKLTVTIAKRWLVDKVVTILKA